MEDPATRLEMFIWAQLNLQNCDVGLWLHHKNRHCITEA